jgi:hypothetical protein
MLTVMLAVNVEIENIDRGLNFVPETLWSSQSSRVIIASTRSISLQIPKASMAEFLKLDLAESAEPVAL